MDSLKFICGIVCAISMIQNTTGLPRQRVSELTPARNISSPRPFVRMKTSSSTKFGMKEGDTVSRIDGKIVFPMDDTDDDVRQQYIPDLESSCENSTFCEDIPNYPSDLVKTALRVNKNLESLSGVDLVPDVVHRVNVPPEDVPLCEYREELVYPKAAQSKDKEWLFVVNDGDFIQGVRIEKCKTESSTCTLIDGFAEGYKTSCKQKYIYRQLVAVSQNGLIKQEKFRFPASCCCHIKFTGNPYMRIGSGLSETSTTVESTSME